MSSSNVFNIPNQLTSSRLLLALVLFVFLAIEWYKTGLVLFIVAASTDWLDGYWARKYGQITVLGRILDPFADKLIICGTFVFLAAVPASKVDAWMAVVILGRELLVTALRSFLEERGKDFSAKTTGKWKMALQCVAAGASIYRLTYPSVSGIAATGVLGPPEWLNCLVVALVWSAVVLTVYSGIDYIAAAVRLVRG
jgi:CDP-diacylglycerol--glycerol-3-phosphate 3-phosphatidyltransferase